MVSLRDSALIVPLLLLISCLFLMLSNEENAAAEVLSAHKTGKHFDCPQIRRSADGLHHACRAPADMYALVEPHQGQNEPIN